MMEPHSVLAEKNVYLHGSWKADYRISENLIKSIAKEISFKPSLPFKLQLTPAGLTLEPQQPADEKAEKAKHLAFDVLRDIFINHYNPKCLLVIYVDTESKFRVLACSGQDDTGIEVVSKAYKDRKNFLLQNGRNSSQPQVPVNWTLAERHRLPSDGRQTLVRENLVKTDSTNGFIPGSRVSANFGTLSRDHRGSSLRSNASSQKQVIPDGGDFQDGDVFTYQRPVIVQELDDLEREPADWIQNEQYKAFSVGVQTMPYEDEADTESINSTVSGQSVKDNGYPVPPRSPTISTKISAEEYYTRKDTGGKRILIPCHSLLEPDHSTHKFIEDDHEKKEDHNGLVAPLTNGVANGKDIILSNLEHELRSVGTLTDQTSKTFRRYAKKQVQLSLSNSYKDKALKKRTTSTSPKSASAGAHPPRGYPEVSTSTLGSSVKSNAFMASQQRVATGPALPVRRTMSSSTVVKPIESVYGVRVTRRSSSGRGQRPIIVYTPFSPTSPK